MLFISSTYLYMFGTKVNTIGKTQGVFFIFSSLLVPTRKRFVLLQSGCGSHSVTESFQTTTIEYRLALEIKRERLSLPTRYSLELPKSFVRGLF